jgi:hypothetical protein
MEHDGLRAYLEDHLIGSEAGLRTARRLHRRATGELRDFAGELIDRIPDEQRVLRDVMHAAGRRPAPATIASRGVGAASSAALWFRRALPESVPAVLEDLEAMIVGVRGKHLLWRTMIAIAAIDEAYERWPFERLAADALEQERTLLGFHERAVRSLH